MAAIVLVILLVLVLENSTLAVRIFKGAGPSFASPLLAGMIYLGTAIMWLVPDRRIEKALADASKG